MQFDWRDCKCQGKYDIPLAARGCELVEVVMSLRTVTDSPEQIDWAQVSKWRGVALVPPAAQEPVAVKVKPMEWNQFGRSCTPVGTYDVSCIAQGGVFGLILPGDQDNTFPHAKEGSEKDCRQAAQAHYEKLIRSALSPPREPAPQVVEDMAALLNRAGILIKEAYDCWNKPDRPGLWPSRASVLIDQIAALASSQEKKG